MQFILSLNMYYYTPAAVAAQSPERKRSFRCRRRSPSSCPPTGPPPCPLQKHRCTILATCYGLCILLSEHNTRICERIMCISGSNPDSPSWSCICVPAAFRLHTDSNSSSAEIFLSATPPSSPPSPPPGASSNLTLVRCREGLAELSI